MPIKKSGSYKGKSNRPGGGGRFQQEVDAIKKGNPSMSDKEAKAIAAIHGRMKYGADQMAKWSAAGRKRSK